MDVYGTTELDTGLGRVRMGGMCHKLAVQVLWNVLHERDGDTNDCTRLEGRKLAKDFHGPDTSAPNGRISTYDWDSISFSRMRRSCAMTQRTLR